MVKKGYTYKDFQVECPICGKTFRTPQGLQGHLRFTPCGQEGVEPSPPNPEAPKLEQVTPVVPQSVSNKQLREAVERLRLQSEIARLTGTAPPPITPDLAQQLGLGELSETTKTMLQERAFGATQKSPSDNIMETAQLVKVLRDLATPEKPQTDGLSQLLSLLKLLGIEDLRSLFTKPTTTAPDGLKLGGINLSGVEISDSILGKLIDYESARETAQAELQGRNTLAETARGIFDRVGEGIGQKIAKEFAGEGKPGIAQVSKRPEPQILEIPCSRCGVVSRADVTNAQAGQDFQFRCKDCGFEETLRLTQAQEGKMTTAGTHQKVKGQKARKPVEGVDYVCCEQCSQAIGVGSKSPGTLVVCPACEHEQLLISPTEPMEPLEPLKEPGY